MRFELQEETLAIYRPDGKPFASFQDLDQQRQLAEEKLKTEQKLRQEEQKLRQEAEDKLAKLQEKLRSLGLNPDDV